MAKKRVRGTLDAEEEEEEERMRAGARWSSESSVVEHFNTLSKHFTTRKVTKHFTARTAGAQSSSAPSVVACVTWR